MSRGLGTTHQKILLLLLGGVAIGLSGSPKRYFKILEAMGKEWHNIDHRALKRAIASLYKSKLVEERYNRDGTVTLLLTDQGKTKALTYNLEKIQIFRPKRWDGKWRIVAYDIPERLSVVRRSFRYHLRQLGFIELQRSVFIHPFECTEQIVFLTEYYTAKRFVRLITATSIDNEISLKQKFSLIS